MTEYRSTQRLPAAARAVLFGVLVIGGIAAGLIWVFAHEYVAVAVVATVVLVGGPAMIAGMYGKVSLDEDRLVLTLVPVFRKVIPREEIASVQAENIDPLRDLGGYGYRLLGGGLVGFVFQRGSAIRVSTRAGKTYVVSDPDGELASRLVR